MASSGDNGRFQLRDGWWLIDWDAIAKIERAMYRATYRYSYSRTTPMPREGGIASHWMPEVNTLEVDFDRVNAKADAEAMLAVADWRRELAARPRLLGGEELRHELAADQAATESAATSFQRKLHSISKKNMENINAADRFWGAMKRGAETARDISAEILVIGGTAIAAPVIAAGGIGAAAGAGGWLAAGSALKGAAKFQDTNNVGAAMIEATSAFGFAVLTPAAELKGAKNIAVIFLAKMPVNTLEGYVEARNDGKSLRKALQAAAVKGVAEAATSVILGSSKVDQMMRKLTIPVATGSPVFRAVLDQAVRRAAR